MAVDEIWKVEYAKANQIRRRENLVNGVTLKRADGGENQQAKPLNPVFVDVRLW